MKKVQDPREGDKERRLVEEGAEGYLEKEGQCGKEEEDIMMVTEAGGGHEPGWSSRRARRA